MNGKWLRTLRFGKNERRDLSLHQKLTGAQQAHEHMHSRSKPEMPTQVRNVRR